MVNMTIEDLEYRIQILESDLKITQDLSFELNNCILRLKDNIIKLQEECINKEGRIWKLTNDMIDVNDYLGEDFIQYKKKKAIKEKLKNG